jgi:G3E family GTPase
MIDALDMLQATPRPFDRIIIEASGAASPGPIISTLLAHPQIDEDFSLTSIVATYDCLGVEPDLDANDEQLAYAGIVCITKCDVGDESAVARARERISSVNPLAKIIELPSASFDPSTLLDAPPIADVVPTSAHHVHSTMSARHIESVEPVDREGFESRLDELLSREHARIFRLKGILDVGEERRYVVQGVHDRWSGSFDRPWNDEPRSNVLVIIGREIDHIDLEELIGVHVSTDR